MAAQIAAVVATAPTAPRWPCVGATRNRPCAAALVRLVAAHAGANGALGVNGQRGILQRLAPRVAVLRAPAHPRGLHATATPASWLHQVALWLGILTTPGLRRGKVPAGADWTAQVRAFLADDNRTMATPFTWTDAGRPRVAEPRHYFSPAVLVVGSNGGRARRGFGGHRIVAGRVHAPLHNALQNACVPCSLNRCGVLRTERNGARQ